ncbi:hypothetical protein CA13_41380 [Planctomycetes bacterium CA13]|uniref:Methane oxygenase PmoA n=1 Tax=Novipirellula herctigrandis TaxID=2527986 RepID=A0A5C5Z645_9BACT|nr:hypothetical protein CA13_41380 [Planctomycetes bacterium CA13]
MTLRHLLALTAFAAATSLAAATSARCDDNVQQSLAIETNYAWKTNDGSVALLAQKTPTQKDEIVWQFHFGDTLTKPYFHPLNLPGGNTLTWASPDDHPWHYGLWFSWKFINGVNYWEEDRATGKSNGTTDWNDVRVQLDSDHSARFEMDLTYHVPDQAPVLTEHRTIEIAPPNSLDDYTIDWTATFKSSADGVVLDRTPLPDQPGGKAYGGYAGLSVRLARDAALFKANDSEGHIQEQQSRHRFRADAVDYAGSIGDSSGGIAILSHPANLNSPSHWYVIRDTSGPMTYFSPAVIQDAPRTLAKNESFTLRYRIIVHSGRFDAAGLKEISSEFSQK